MLWSGQLMLRTCLIVWLGASPPENAPAPVLGADADLVEATAWMHVIGYILVAVIRTARLGGVR